MAPAPRLRQGEPGMAPGWPRLPGSGRVSPGWPRLPGPAPRPDTCRRRPAAPGPGGAPPPPLKPGRPRQLPSLFACLPCLPAPSARRDRAADMGGKTGKSVLCFGFPLSIFFIVINEFCERFSYYGMKAVLTLYFTRFLRWDDNFATAIYHTFVALCYLTPILGAIIADSWLGKFKTILYLSIVYAIGQAVLSVGSISELTGGTASNLAPNIALSMIGLILIALGTGGIKPCVSAFGGDQFEEDQERQRGTFFSLFYLSINAGSLLSTLITPTLRATECGIHTKQECYPLAFGVPAILMAVALVVFVIGSKMYKKIKPQGNIMLEVSKCVGFAIKNRFRHRSKKFPKREHWLDWASDKYDKRLIAQTKMVLRVLFLYIPLPMFWAVFDQQGSRWTLQATAMDGDFGFQIQPDQMQIVNPILIVIMVPIVDSVLYPLIKKCKLNFTPLKKMTVGMFLGALAFVAAALVQVQIDKTYPVFPAAGQAQIKLINVGEIPATVQFQPQLDSVNIAPKTETGYMIYEASKLQSAHISTAILNKTVPLDLLKKERYTLAFKWDSPNISSNLIWDNITSKPENGKSLVRFINSLSFTVNVTMGDTDFGELDPLSVTNYSFVPKPDGSYTINVSTPEVACTAVSKKFGYGSVYTISLDYCISNQLSITYFEDIAPNTVHMAWQIPQYFLLTCAEVLFSVTGLEFSYSQAPSNMKSVLQAGWLLTVAVGNIIVLIVAGASTIDKQWAEYVLFAALLLVVCFIFSVMASFYTYIDPNEIEAQFSEEEKKEHKKDQDDNEKEADSRM
ncbi:solute carrier family 15 member 1 [Oenanthe melanoleuca]|uniref:solute carrier family 15 member 1 n=1 Tax=Oenanthe melanoleuca TaxID=2939378 RepID=UPI0024C1698A|nr:solute carrier family 15 member 1 [Oenanthe melanoleuca]